MLNPRKQKAYYSDKSYEFKFIYAYMSYMYNLCKMCSNNNSDMKEKENFLYGYKFNIFFFFWSKPPY